MSLTRRREESAPIILWTNVKRAATRLPGLSRISFSLKEVAYSFLQNDWFITGRVMLRRNIDAPKGLVNGATGTLKKVHLSSIGEATALTIVFDGQAGEQLVKKVRD